MVKDVTNALSNKNEGLMRMSSIFLILCGVDLASLGWMMTSTMGTSK